MTAIPLAPLPEIDFLFDEDPPGVTYVIELYRPFGAPTIRFGWCATAEEAYEWLDQRHLHGGVFAVLPLDTDTAPGAAVWK